MEITAIKLLEEVENYDARFNDAADNIVALRSELAQALDAKANAEVERGEYSKRACKCPTGCSAAARLAEALNAQAELRTVADRMGSELVELRGEK